MELMLLREEVENLRIETNHAATIGNFTDLMYDADSESEVLSILLYALPQVIEYDELRYFALDRKNIQLVETNIVTPVMEKAEEVIDGLTVPLNIFGGVLADSVLRQEMSTMENGIQDGDEFAIRFNSDRYLVVPLISRKFRKIPSMNRDQYRNEDEYINAYIQSEEYPVVGTIWINITSIPDAQIAGSISLVTSLLHTAGSVIGELRMVERIVENNERIEKDLRAARDVQMGLLPRELPQNDLIQAAAKYLTEDQVGGDYYDSFEICDGVYAITVADASGHGTPSALIMAMTKILLKTFAKEGVSPSDTLELVNQAIVNNTKTNKFITVFYAILDTNEKKIHYTSAGHCPQLLLNKNTNISTELLSDGLFVGMFPAFNLDTHSIEYTPGINRLVLYTDGLTESTNNDETMYGMQRLENSSLSCLDRNLEDSLDKILQDQQRFIHNHPKDDDLTLMIVDF